MDKINILGINISLINKGDIIKKVEEFLKDGKQHYIVTPNPEILLKSYSEEEYFYILNNADLAIADGVGLFFAGLVMGKKVPRYTGADLLVDILRTANEKNIKIGIFNWREGLSRAEKIKQFLKKQYPKLNFAIENIDREQGMPHYRTMNIFKPEIIFVNTGAPYQEKFIFNNLKKLPYVKLAIGIGGAVDFLTGKAKRAPRIIRSLGFEWMWRLIKQPKRWRRIYRAFIVFSFKFMVWRFIRPFKYRPNVACLLYKKENNKYKILIVERQSEKNHWQIPQGGTDGESIEAAGRRELTEEIGNNNFKPIASIKNIFKYKFNNEISRAGILSKKIQGYKGQKQGLFIAEFTGQDNDIKINYWDHKQWKWVDTEKLIDSVHHERRRGVEIFLKHFNKILNLDKQNNT